MVLRRGGGGHADRARRSAVPLVSVRLSQQSQDNRPRANEACERLATNQIRYRAVLVQDLS